MMVPSQFRVAVVMLAWLGGTTTVGLAQAPIGLTPRTEEVAANSVSGRVNINTPAATIGPRSVPRFDGAAAPGLKLTLDGSASSGGRVWYRWIQTQGPRVNIQGADQAVATLVVPDDALSIVFVLVVGNSSGVDARGLTIEVKDPNLNDNLADLRAEAGSDQTAVVGRRLILDGKASEPRGRIRYRWVQVSGSKVTNLTTTGSTCSFIPEATGDSQFALMVIGGTGLVSEASLVTIHTRGARSTVGGQTATDSALDEFSRRAVQSIRGGDQFAPALAEAFDLVAGQVDSCKTYLAAATELTRRFDAIIPGDVDRRSDWVDGFFKPWTTRIAEAMRRAGVDLTTTEGQGKPLTKEQRSRLTSELRFTAAGLRAANRLR